MLIPKKNNLQKGWQENRKFAIESKHETAFSLDRNNDLYNCKKAIFKSALIVYCYRYCQVKIDGVDLFVLKPAYARAIAMKNTLKIHKKTKCQ